MYVVETAVVPVDVRPRKTVVQTEIAVYGEGAVAQKDGTAKYSPGGWCRDRPGRGWDFGGSGRVSKDPPATRFGRLQRCRRIVRVPGHGRDRRWENVEPGFVRVVYTVGVAVDCLEVLGEVFVTACSSVVGSGITCSNELCGEMGSMPSTIENYEVEIGRP